MLGILFTYQRQNLRLVRWHNNFFREYNWLLFCESVFVSLVFYSHPRFWGHVSS